MGKKPYNKENDSKNESKTFKKGSRKPGGKEFKGDKRDKRSGNINDASYYYDNADILNQITNYSFEQFLGVPATIGKSSANLSYRAGNIMAIWLNPSVQPTTDDTFSTTYGINMAGMRNFLQLSANNAKTTNYGPQDPMLLLLALRSVIEMYGFIVRAFGILPLYNQRNREYPNRLLQVMGIDADDLRKNYASYRVRLNMDIALLDRVPFIADIPIFKKAAEIYSGIYLDEDSPMAQTYFFAPYSVWTLNEAYNPQGIGLDTTVVYNNGSVMMSWYLDLFEAQINALATSSVLNYVYSDILRVCEGGKHGLLTLPTIPEQYFVQPAVNHEIRTWIHNMMVMGIPLALDDMPVGWTTGMTGLNDVETNTNQDGINYSPMFKFSNRTDTADTLSILENAIVDFETMNPGVEDRVAATRLAARTRVLATGSGVTPAGTYSGSRPAIGDYYVTFFTVDNGDACTASTNFADSVNSMTAGQLKTQLWFVSQLDQFNFAPLMYYVGRDYDSVDHVIGIHGDINYYTTLDYDYMVQMRDAEMISEFGFRL